MQHAEDFDRIVADAVKGEILANDEMAEARSNVIP